MCIHHNPSKLIAMKCSMLAAVSGMPRVLAAMAELAKGVEMASRPESQIDDGTAFECSVTLEQLAFALEVMSADLRVKSQEIAPITQPTGAKASYGCRVVVLPGGVPSICCAPEVYRAVGNEGVHGHLCGTHASELDPEVLQRAYVKI